MFVVTFPSGSVTVSTSPKLLYEYDVVAVVVELSGRDSDSRLLDESYVNVVVFPAGSVVVKILPFESYVLTISPRVVQVEHPEP